MIQLMPIEINDKKLFHDIAIKKQVKNSHCADCVNDECDTCIYSNRAKMLNIEEHIYSEYDFYMQNSQQLNMIVPNNKITEDEKKILKDSYKHSADFKEIKKRIHDNLPNTMKGKCPFCMISEPSTLEHYFPEDTYPEYILFTPNIVPCCSPCNTYKGTEIFRDGQRTILHYYFDKIPEKNFLKATIVIEDGIPVVTFLLDIDENDEIDRIIKLQFDKLHLFERYKKQCDNIISTLCFEVCDSYRHDLDIDSCIKTINKRIKALRKTNGNNYWLASLYEAIAENKTAFEEMLKCYESL